MTIWLSRAWMVIVWGAGDRWALNSRRAWPLSTFCFYCSERKGSLRVKMMGVPPSMATLKRKLPLSLGWVGMSAVSTVYRPSLPATSNQRSILPI